MEIVEIKSQHLSIASQPHQTPKDASKSTNLLSTGESEFKTQESVGISQKPKRKWSREEIKQWLSFVLLRIMQKPFEDIEVEFTAACHHEEIYRILEKHIKTKSAKDCQILTKRTLYMVKKDGNAQLGSWAVTKLKRQTDQQSKALVKRYEEHVVTKSDYMKFLQEFEEAYQ